MSSDCQRPSVRCPDEPVKPTGPELDGGYVLENAPGYDVLIDLLKGQILWPEIAWPLTVDAIWAAGRFLAALNHGKLDPHDQQVRIQVATELQAWAPGFAVLSRVFSKARYIDPLVVNGSVAVRCSLIDPEVKQLQDDIIRKANQDVRVRVCP